MNNVILVDDDPCILDGLSKIIRWEDYGCSVTALFSDAAAAINYCKNNAVSIVVSDIKMPGMLGTELAGELKKMNPDMITILLSAYESFDYARDAVNNRVFRYLVKPVNVDELTETIAAAADTASRISSSHAERSELISFRKSQKYKNFLLSLFDEGEEPKPDKDTEIFYANGHLKPYHLFVARRESRIPESLTETGDGSIIFHFQRKNLEYNIYTGNEESAGTWLSGLQNSCIYSGTPAACCMKISSLETLSSDCKKLSFYLHAREYLDEGCLCTLPVAPRKVLTNNPEDLKKLRELSKILFKSILNGDFPKVQEVITEISQIIKNPLRAVSPQIVKSTYIKTLNDLSDYYQKYYPTHEDSLRCIRRSTESINNDTVFYQDSDQILNLAHDLYSREFLSKDSSVQTVNKMKLFISQSLDKEINISDIAESVHMSPAYVSTLFRKITGEKLWSYVIRVRMEKAHDYLIHTDIPIAQIASMCGYQSLNTFYYCFKQLYGVTPGHFRQNPEEENS